jgi:hypothetical protein
MKGLLADADVIGQCQVLVDIWRADVWRSIWIELNCKVESFRSLGLPADATDDLVWHTCQNHQLVLITGNRNHDGPESLEAVLRANNRDEDLPVITFADPRRIVLDHEYAKLVAERTLELLISIENFRGVGRVYAP